MKRILVLMTATAMMAAMMAMPPGWVTLSPPLHVKVRPSDDVLHVVAANAGADIATIIAAATRPAVANNNMRFIRATAFRKGRGERAVKGCTGMYSRTHSAPAQVTFTPYPSIGAGASLK